MIKKNSEKNTFVLRLVFLLSLTLAFFGIPETKFVWAVAPADSDIIYGNDGLPGYVGALLGGNFPSASNVNATPSVGLTAGTRIGNTLGLGLLGSFYPQENTGGFLGLATNTSMSVVVIAAQGNIYLSGLHFGPEIGAAMRFLSNALTTPNTGNTTTTPLVGVQLGYDYKLSRSISLGIDAHYFIPTASTEVNFLQAFAVAKIWL